MLVQSPSWPGGGGTLQVHRPWIWLALAGLAPEVRFISSRENDPRWGFDDYYVGRVGPAAAAVASCQCLISAQVLPAALYAPTCVAVTTHWASPASGGGGGIASASKVRWKSYFDDDDTTERHDSPPPWCVGLTLVVGTAANQGGSVSRRLTHSICEKAMDSPVRAFANLLPTPRLGFRHAHDSRSAR